MNHESFMRLAYEQALLALSIGEVPIGCVIEYNGEVIASGYNRRITEKNVLRHAEIIAIEDACKVVGDWRLEGCTMYVTAEPCPMCAGAILQARMDTVVFGAANKKAGAAGSVINILSHDGFNHRVNIVEGILKDECAALLSEFFARLRGV